MNQIVFCLTVCAVLLVGMNSSLASTDKFVVLDKKGMQSKLIGNKLKLETADKIKVITHTTENGTYREWYVYKGNTFRLTGRWWFLGNETICYLVRPGNKVRQNCRRIMVRGNQVMTVPTNSDVPVATGVIAPGDQIPK